MTTQRFFVAPQAIQGGAVELSERQAHQISSVLRLSPGDHILVLDNSGWQYDAVLADVDARRTLATVRSRKLVTTEPRTKITIYQALLKGSRFEFVLQKCTELGAAAFVPTICDRCIVSSASDGRSAKLERWERIIVEAAEQSGRGKLPTVQPATLFHQACEAVRGFSIIPWEGEEGLHLREALRQQANTPTEAPDKKKKTSRARPFTINVFIGPEGGFTDEEMERAKSYGIVPVTLGARILRAETAAIATTAVLLYEMGDLG